MSRSMNANGCRCTCSSEFKWRNHLSPFLSVGKGVGPVGGMVCFLLRKPEALRELRIEGGESSKG